MLLSVEENAIFANTVFSSLQPDYADAFARNLHLPPDSAAAAVRVVNEELAGLCRGSTKVGAGNGT